MREPMPNPSTRDTSNAMREIADAVASLRNDMRRDVGEIKTMTSSAAMPSDIKADLARIAEQINSFDNSRSDMAANGIQNELEELRTMVNELAREDSMRRLETRWDGFEERISDLDSASIRDEMITLSYRLDDIKSSIGLLPSALPLHALEDKIKMLVTAIDSMSRQPSAADPELTRQFAILDDRLDEISRAIVANSVAQPSGMDTAAVARLENRLDSLVDHIGQLGQSDADGELAMRMEALASRVEDLANQEAYGALMERLDLLSHSLAEQAATSDPRVISQLEDLSRKVEGLDLEMANGPLGDQLKDLAHRIDSINSELTATNGNQDMLYVRLEDLADRVQESASRPSVVDFSPLEARLADIAARLDESQAPQYGNDESIRSLEDQVAGLSQLLSNSGDSSAQYDNVTAELEPRLAAIEGHLSNSKADSQDIVIEAARQAAEAAIASYRQSGVPAADMATIESLVGDLRSLENLSRKSEERSARTIDAVHDTLLKIASRLETLEATPRHAERENVADYAQEEAQFGSAPHAASAVYTRREEALAGDHGDGFAPDVHHDLPKRENAPSGDSLLKGLKKRISGKRADTAESPRQNGLQNVNPSPSIDPVADIDPETANIPMEPGSGSPDIKRIMAKVREAQQLADQDHPQPAEPEKNDFIAAARRAARAAATEAGEIDKPVADEEKASLSLKQTVVRRRKPLLMAAGAILLAVLSYPLIAGFIANDEQPVRSASLDVPAVTVPAKQPVTEPLADANDTLPQVRVGTSQEADASAIAGNSDPAPQKIIPLDATAQQNQGFQPAQSEAPTQTASLSQDSGSSLQAIEMPPEAAGPFELREAAANGDGLALFEIGARYTDGRGVPTDLSEAAKWYRLSAETGFAPAQYRLANFYEKGTGVDRDIDQALTWYQMAAEQGNASAMHNLAVLYAMGRDGVSDYDSAGNWFTRAADLGVKDSQFNLAILHARGNGVEQNLEDSYKWFAIAAKSGDKDAARKRDEVAAALRPEQLQSARAKVESWSPAVLVESANSTQIPAEWRGVETRTASVDMKKAIKNIQGILTKNGFDTGGTDGIMGNRTISAIKEFQTSVGLEPTGEVNDALVKELLARNN
tara:strand:+ start:36948 stop:40271 length:3324 start_codon:yes stop_codon:yes gene_type:complete